jgi:hypothetical protein
MKPSTRQPLFIITGASCVGKSALCEILFQKETEYIALESDILWHDVYNTPDDDYRAYRQTWLRLCADISQIGKPVVLCGCATPEQFEPLPERELFAEIHYLAVVCDDLVLESRMRNGRGISEENWIESSKQFNNWLKDNGKSHGIFLLDNSGLTAKETAEIADNWILDAII